MTRNKKTKHRMKIIQEFHLNKMEQKRLDNSVKNGYFTYKLIYKNKNDPDSLKLWYRFIKHMRCVRFGLDN